MLKRKIIELLNSEFDEGIDAVNSAKWKRENNSFRGSESVGNLESLDALNQKVRILAEENMSSNEWLREVKVAKTTAKHIVNNSKVQGHYSPDAIQKAVAVVAKIAKTYPFCHPTFISTLYRSHCETSVIPVGIGWCLHLKQVASFENFLLQSSKCVAQAWLAAASAIL